MTILYSADVMKYIVKAIDDGLDIRYFYVKKLDRDQAAIVYKSLKDKCNTNMLFLQDFGAPQMNEIYEGMIRGLSNNQIKKFAKSIIPWNVMGCMRICLENNFDFDEICGDKKFDFDNWDKITIFANILYDCSFINNGYKFTSEKYGYNVSLNDLKEIAKKYNSEIFDEIIKGFKNGNDPRIFMKDGFNARQAKVINEIINRNKEFNLPIDQVELIIDPNINDEIMFELFYAIKDGVKNIRPLLKLDDFKKIRTIGWIASSLNVPEESLEKICNNDFSERQMEIIAKAIDRGLNIDKYINPEYSYEQLVEIFKGIESKVDVSKYDSKYLSYKEMREIRKGLSKGLDVDQYSNYQAGIMYLKRKGLENNHSIDYYVNIVKNEFEKDDEELLNSLNLYALNNKENNYA